MALETKLLQKLSQNLMMTPQLQQAIKLLQLGRLEYLEAIEKELLENPLLEELKEEAGESSVSTPPVSEESGVESPAVPSANDSDLSSEQKSSSEQEPQMDWENYLENLSDTRGTATPRGLVDHEDRPSLEGAMTRAETLSDHLIAQIRLADLSESDVRIAQIIIGNLDRNGYLAEPLEEIARSGDFSTQDIQRVLEVIRFLDPIGVGARDLQECLIIQLENMGLGSALEARIVSNHLEKLEKRKYDQIAKAEHVEVEDVYRAVSIIRKLEPRPGRPFVDDSTRYVVPDIYVYRVGGEYVITLNEDGLPKLRVSPYYLRLLKNDDAENVPNKAYLNERLKAASWLIRSIHQRQQTIFRVTESIVKFQREFLDHGISRLRPLVLKDVADDIGMHESTVSRVTTDKYVHTPQGVFELKFFFTTGIKTSEGDVSSSSIKERIKNLIAAESPDSPLSDQQLVEILKRENISIARRTVAKYREGMGIESSSQRKKPF